ncbi:MAG: hypothetical protein AAGK32_06720, partial [Actinomycetota bacterium]
MPATLAEALNDDRVDWPDLRSRYGPVLQLVDVLIGLVPNCDRYLEIWPVGFRTYNLMVPNFLNLPALLLGRGAPKDLVGLGLYASSRAASCAYCSAHTCSFALRRGATEAAVTGEARTPEEQATVALAEGLSTMPHHHDPARTDELAALIGADEAEWVAMGVAMMGFLNKFMDGMGVELEQGAVDDVAQMIEPTGWAVGQHGWAGAGSDGSGGPPAPDSFGTVLRVGRNAPGAVLLERRWMRGLPRSAPDLRRHLQEQYGYDEPLLTAMNHGKPRRALGAMLRHNLDPAQSDLGLDTKALCGLVFAVMAENELLVAASRALASHHGVAPALIDAAAAYAERAGRKPGAGIDPADRTNGAEAPASNGTNDAGDGPFDAHTGAALAMAAAMAPSP